MIHVCTPLQRSSGSEARKDPLSGVSFDSDGHEALAHRGWYFHVGLLVLTSFALGSAR
jgi:hypothetical protein